jgi:hypothetical protein
MNARTMPGLTALLDRHIPRWRAGLRSRNKVLRDRALAILQAPRALAVGLRGAVWWARMAGVSRALRPWRSIALAPAAFEAYCAHANAAPVASAEALVAGTIDWPRLWSLGPSTPIADHSRILKADGTPHSPFDQASLAYPTGQRAYLRTRSGIVFPRSGLVMPELGVVLRNDRPRWLVEHRFIPGFIDFVNDKLLTREGGLHPSRCIRRPVLVVCHVYHRNYAHWLGDCLPWLIPWLGHLRDGRLAVLVPPLVSAWQRRTLELLGVPASAVIEAGEESVLCADMIVPGLLMLQMVAQFRPDLASTPVGVKALPYGPSGPVLGRVIAETIETLRAAVRPQTSIDRPERIYVSRRGVRSFRTMLNEHEVEAAMTRLGFEIVRTEDYSVDDQVAMFSRARVVVGPHGAGLTNAAFAPSGCLVIDIFHDSWRPFWMLNLTQLFEHHYLPVAYASDPELSQPLLLGNVTFSRSHAYRVPTNELTAVVISAMRALGLDRNGVTDTAN